MARLNLLLRQMSCNKTTGNGKQKVLASIDNGEAVPRLFDIFKVMMDSIPAAVKPNFSERNPHKLPDSHISSSVRRPQQNNASTLLFSGFPFMFH